MEAKYVVEFAQQMGFFGKGWIFASAYSTKKEADSAKSRILAHRKKIGGIPEVRVITMAAYQKSVLK